MGSFVNALLFVCVAFGVVSCKTSSQLEEKKDIHIEHSSESITTGMTETSFRDFLRMSILERIAGSAVLWSAPDSNGIQYKLADIDIISLKEIVTNQERELHQNDSISSLQTEQDSIDDNSTLKTLEKQDSRPFDLTIIIIVLGISLLFFLWLRFRK